MAVNKQKFNSEVEKLRAFSLRLQTASENDNELVKQLNSLSEESRSSLFSLYQHAEGPVKNIRKEVAGILSQRDIQLSELQTIVTDAVAEKPKSFGRMYKSWYNMLYMFLIADFRVEMVEAMNYISNSVIDELGVNGEIIAKKFDFTGERETGSTRCWIAFINHTHIKQTTAKQLFINIQHGTVEFSFYDRPKNQMRDRVIIEKGNAFDFDQLNTVFQNYKKEILDNKWIPEVWYWRIGTRDNMRSYWGEMKANNKICIGWSEIGDLKEADVKNKEDIIQLLIEEGFYGEDKRTRSKKAGEIFNFYKLVKIGDIVLAQDGDKVLGIGRVVGDYEYNYGSGFPHQKEVEWLITDLDLSNDIGRLTTVFQIRDYGRIQDIENLIASGNTSTENDEINKIPAKMNQSLNQILYGPPGTGKTYNTINKALEIVGENIEGKTRKEIKKRFDELLIDDWDNPNGQIGFITFHQSMSYEDFIEGIKPDVNENDEVIYDIEPGIFKRMASIARDNWLDATKGTKEQLSFEDAFTRLKEEWDIDPEMKFPLKTPGYDYKILGFTKTSIKFEKASGGTGHTLSIATLSDYFYKRREVRQTGVGIYYPAILEKLESYQSSTTVIKEEKNYVLIIDEINRGNVSQIFGELITLIEDDKRLGQPEALELTLPYSKEKFGVPPNLYIIGTMNTADRSVEALDAALRRRFSFEEMPPQPDLITSSETLRCFWLNNIGVYGGSREEYDEYEADIRSLLGINVVDYNAYIALGESKPISDKEEFSKKLVGLISFNGIDLSKLLIFINQRIEKLLDKDHQVGHSYFMSVDSMEKLQTAFYNKIIPLLQEYFFGSYDKIGLVLGDGFVRLKSVESGIFADFNSESAADFEDRPVYEIIDYRKAGHAHRLSINKQDIDMTFEKAIRRLMKQSIG